MRSIRLSLVLCYLLLLVLSLGAISVLDYQATERGLGTRKNTIGELVAAKYDVRCRVERYKLDHDLLERAKNLGGGVQVEVLFPDFLAQRAYPLIVLGTSVPVPCGQTVG